MEALSNKQDTSTVICVNAVNKNDGGAQQLRHSSCQYKTHKFIVLVCYKFHSTLQIGDKSTMFHHFIFAAPRHIELPVLKPRPHAYSLNRSVSEFSAATADVRL
jgi:hypothetical protein